MLMLSSTNEVVVNHLPGRRCVVDGDFQRRHRSWALKDEQNFSRWKERRQQLRQRPRKHKVVLCDEKTGRMGGLEEK